MLVDADVGESEGARNGVVEEGDVFYSYE